MTNLDELQALLDAATPGPWAHRMGEIVQLSDGNKGYPLDYYPDCADVISTDRDGDLTMSDANADLIAAMRSALPALIAVARAAEAWRNDLNSAAGQNYALKHALVVAIDANLAALNGATK